MVTMRMELREPLASELGCLPLSVELGARGRESLELALDLARSLAERLALVTHPVDAADRIRLARALSLNLVDLLEEHAIR
jgi:hypothetical protein